MRDGGGLITVDEMAAASRLSTSQIRRYLGAGLIPHEKNGRRFLVHRGAFEAWLLNGPSVEPEKPQTLEQIPAGRQTLSQPPIVTQLPDGSILVRLELVIRQEPRPFAGR